LVLQEILIDEHPDGIWQADRRYSADTEAGLFSHKVSIRHLDRLTNRFSHPFEVSPIRATN
jgi:hypothetical protein